MAPWDISKHKNEPLVAVTYIGDPANKGDGPDVLESWGFMFPKGEAVEVPESLAARLSKSAHFQTGCAEQVSEDEQDDDHEQDDPTKGLGIDALREMAAKLEMSHDGMKKGALRAAIREKLRG